MALGQSFFIFFGAMAFQGVQMTGMPCERPLRLKFFVPVTRPGALAQVRKAHPQF